MQSYSNQDDLAAAVAELSRRDAATSACSWRAMACRRCGACEPGLASLLRIVTDQLISLKAGEAIWQRLEAGLPMGDANSLAAASEDRLRGFGLSGGKARSFRAIAQAVVAGGLDVQALELLDDDTVLKRLQSIPGIGPWTAQIYLLMALNRQRWLAGGRPRPAGGGPGPFRPPGPAQPCRHARAWRRPGGPGGGAAALPAVAPLSRPARNAPADPRHGGLHRMSH